MTNPPTESYIEKVKEQFWREKAERFNGYQKWLFEECSDFLTSALQNLVKRIEEDVEEMYDFPCKCDRKQIECLHNYDQMYLFINLLKRYKSENKK